MSALKTRLGALVKAQAEAENRRGGCTACRHLGPAWRCGQVIIGTADFLAKHQALDHTRGVIFLPERREIAR